MSKLRASFLKACNAIGDHSGCHQIPDRCFRINGYLFPLCARCTGVTVGQLIALLLGLFGVRCNPYVCMFGLLIMGLDWLIQWIGLFPSTNLRRLITGLLGGFGLFQLYFFLFDQMIDRFF